MNAPQPLPDDPDARAVEMTTRLLAAGAREVRIERSGKTLRVWATGGAQEAPARELRTGRK